MSDPVAATDGGDTDRGALGDLTESNPLYEGFPRRCGVVCLSDRPGDRAVKSFSLGGPDLVDPEELTR